MSNAPTELFVSESRIPAPAVSVLVPICNVERYLEECLDSLLAQTFSDFEAICINDGSTDARIPAPAVSVLVPICNVERYLEECLDSLLAQTFSDFEAICINDGSTDGSRAIIQRYLDADPRFRVIDKPNSGYGASMNLGLDHAVDPRFRVIDKPNSGYGASMNLGLDHAVGTYIAILESDDFYEPNALELLVGAARANMSDVVKADFYLYWSQPEPRDELFGIVGAARANMSDVVKADFYLYWSQPEPRDELFGILDERQVGRTMRPLDDVAIFFRKPSIWSALYKVDFLRARGIRFLETPGASYQDAGFNFKVWASAERATFIPQAILHYRQDNEKSSVNSAAKVFCVCDEYASVGERRARNVHPAGHSALPTGQREVLGELRRQGVLRVRRVCFHANVR